MFQLCLEYFKTVSVFIVLEVYMQKLDYIVSMDLLFLQYSVPALIPKLPNFY